ncbi:MAG: cytochrome c biogenesis protein ResB [Thermodesulfovibrionales bacterium]|nr:cytochrome c biogenesis protein ResB [Thermodesulfovibrionales bacterium]MDP3112063.1 cytochrome c biogenesis protein ResB [Thermodesulfovibrionales bacterium]
MGLLKKLLDFFLSLRTAIWLMLALVLMLLFGSVIMPGRPEFSSMNSMPLFDWLTENNIGITWWLYGAIGLLSLLTANTLLCSVESLLKKRQHRTWLLIISPQIIHIGFLFILLAHFLSSAGSFKSNAVAYEGSAFLLPNNLTVKVNDINININPSGYISDWTVNIEYFSGSEKIKEDSLSPNSPSFYKGLGIYLKDIQPYPIKAVLLEVSKEPGAVWALVGGILFMLGTITLLILKIKRESY